ncbi:MAG: hypothetical protein KIT17_00650 [Rubrivivax sp.]|nr:hypothetical protein [Rubrivivax sp.]
MTSHNGTAPRAAPYPATTRAKGWRFELDYEQIEQSTTWDLAAETPMAQHCLLMMWLVAWRQVPCGSFPDNEDEIRAKCRIPREMWTAARDVFMRGWWLADDGRLYHHTIAGRVVEMLGRRRGDADRQAARRSRKAAEAAAVGTGHSEVTRDTGVTHHDVTPGTMRTHAEVRRESSTDHRPPSTGTRTESGDGGVGDVGEGVARERNVTRDAGVTHAKSGVTTLGEGPTSPAARKPARKRAAPTALPKPEDVTTEAWDGWVELREQKRAPVTALVLEGARKEAALAKLTLDEFLRVWVYRGSQGLHADWLTPKDRAVVGGAHVHRGPAGQPRMSKEERDAEAMRLLGIDPALHVQGEAVVVDGVEVLDAK